MTERITRPPPPPVHARPKGPEIPNRPTGPNNTKPPDPPLKPNRPVSQLVRNTMSVDLAKLDEPGHLPLCARVLSACGAGGTKLQKGEDIMLHCVDENRVVVATDSAGKVHQIPVYAKQLYEILPLDPRLDDVVYEGTASLFKSNPTPKAIRVLEGFCAEDEDETKEPDDIIYIQNMDNKVMLGRIAGGDESYGVRYLKMEDTAKYTTMIFPNAVPMSRVIEEEMPMRVRTADSEDNGDDDGVKRCGYVLKLESVRTRKRVLATRIKDSKVFAIPLETRIPLESVMPTTWPHLQALIKPMYSIVNASLCLDGTARDTVPDHYRETMMMTPRPLQKALDSWLKSFEGKARVTEIVHADNAELQRKLAQQEDELHTITKQLRELQQQSQADPSPGGQQGGPPLPPRQNLTPSTSDQQSGASHSSDITMPRRHSVAYSASSPSNTTTGSQPRRIIDAREGDGYDLVSLNARMSQAYSGLARTDLEKQLKRLLDEKVLEEQSRTEEMKHLKRQYEALLTTLGHERESHLKAVEQYEAQCDDLDAYALLNDPKPGTHMASNISKQQQPKLQLQPHFPASHEHTQPHTTGKLSRSLDSLPRSANRSHTHHQGGTFRQSPSTRTPPFSPLPKIPAVTPEPHLPPQTEIPRQSVGPTSKTRETEVGGRHDNAFRRGLTQPLKSSNQASGSLGRSRSTSAMGPLPPTPAVARSSSQTDTVKLERTNPDQFVRSAPPLPNPQPYQEIPISPVEFGDDDAAEYNYPDVPPPPLPPYPQHTNQASSSPQNSKSSETVHSTPNRKIHTYTTEDVAALLKSLDLGNCVKRFLEETVDGALLLSIDEEMMIKELGMTRYEARKLAMKIDELISR